MYSASICDLCQLAQHPFADCFHHLVQMKVIAMSISLYDIKGGIFISDSRFHEREE